MIRRSPTIYVQAYSPTIYASGYHMVRHSPYMYQDGQAYPDIYIWIKENQVKQDAPSSSRS